MTLFQISIRLVFKFVPAMTILQAQMTLHSKYVNACLAGEPRPSVPQRVYEDLGLLAPLCSHDGRKSRQLPKETKVRDDRESSPSQPVFSPTSVHGVNDIQILRSLSGPRAGSPTGGRWDVPTSCLTCSPNPTTRLA